MSADAENAAGKSGGIVALVLLTLVAVGAGAGHGLFTFDKVGSVQKPVPNVADVQKSEPPPAGGATGAKPKLPSKLVTRDMQPLITNLSMPPDMWVRLEATLVFDQAEIDNPDIALAEVSGDLLGYLRSLTLRELQGADGLMFLRQDLKERVTLRTQNRIRDIIIQALVVQ